MRKHDMIGAAVSVSIDVIAPIYEPIHMVGVVYSRTKGAQPTWLSGVTSATMGTIVDSLGKAEP